MLFILDGVAGGAIVLAHGFSLLFTAVYDLLVAFRIVVRRRRDQHAKVDVLLDTEGAIVDGLARLSQQNLIRLASEKINIKVRTFHPSQRSSFEKMCGQWDLNDRTIYLDYFLPAEYLMPVFMHEIAHVLTMTKGMKDHHNDAWAQANEELGGDAFGPEHMSEVSSLTPYVWMNLSIMLSGGQIVIRSDEHLRKVQIR